MTFAISAPRTAAAQSLGLKVETTRTSLVLKEGVTIEEYIDIVGALSQLNDANQWWTADALKEGWRRWGEISQEAVTVFHHKPQTLYNLRAVSERVAPHRRRAAVSFTHHRLVAFLDEATQDHWLKVAEAEDLTCEQLVDAIKAGHIRSRREDHVWRFRLEPPDYQANLWSRASDLVREEPNEFAAKAMTERAERIVGNGNLLSRVDSAVSEGE